MKYKDRVIESSYPIWLYLLPNQLHLFIDSNNLMLCQFAQVWKLSCIMEASYQVVEYRGCDIEYIVFEGSHEECSQWLEDNCFQDVDLMGDLNWVSNDPSNVNGNGFAFRYTIREIENDEV